MRCLGEITGRQKAERFVAHLLTQDVPTHIEFCSNNGDDQWEIWVRDEDQVDLAVKELKAFVANPDDARYHAALAEASRILQEREKARVEAAKNVHRMDTTVVRPAMVGRGPMPPLTLTLIILCVGIGLITSFGRPSANNRWAITTMTQLAFVTPTDYQESGGNPAASIKKGQLWRVITPIFLHGDIIHLAINMFGLVVLGAVLERLMGTPRFAVFVLVLAIVPNLLQGLMPPSLGGYHNFVGISGVIYGYLGYIWVRSTVNPSFGIRIPMPLMVLAIGSIVVGLAGVFPGWQYADLCHLGGLIVGVAFGFASEQTATQ